MSVSLEKGARVSLAKKDSDLKRVLVCLGWKANKRKGFFSRDFDLDASAVTCRNGRYAGRKDVCYYGDKGRQGDAVWHCSGDNLTGGDGIHDDEQILVDLTKLNDDRDRIVFIVNIYDARARKQSFANVEKAFIRLVNYDTNEELYRFDISNGGVGDVSGLIFAELYRKNGEWKFAAIGEGVKEEGIFEIAARI